MDTSVKNMRLNVFGVSSTEPFEKVVVSSSYSTKVTAGYETMWEKETYQALTKQTMQDFFQRISPFFTFPTTTGYI